MNSTIDSSISENNYEFRALSDVQKQVLAILPIPSALLSIIGSTIIIVMLLKVRTTKSWIPYQRLLLAMSICDIVSSLTLAAGSFLYPKETSDKVWVIGNDASCSAIGFLNQVSYSGILYNGMLSFYFLFTARFGMKNEQIQKRIEPAMHVFSIGFPFVTAFVGLFMGVYHEPELGIGCWVNRWPDLCGEGPDGTGEECQSPLVAWIFGAWIALGVLATLIVNNAVIWYFVHKRTRQGQGATISRAPSTLVEEKGVDTSDSNSHQSEGEETKNTAAGRKSQMGLISMASSFRTLNSARVSGNASVTTAVQREFQATQNKRLRLVGSQAFLFVGCYFVSNIWTYILRLYEAQATDYVEEKELPYRYYAFLVLQAALLPLQGLFNMIVFIRPKYLRLRSDFPSESKWSITHRVIFGEAAKGNASGSAERVTGKQMVEVKPLPKKGVSSLTLTSELPQPSAVPPTQAKTETSPDDADDDPSAVSRPGMSKDLSAIFETSERTTERTRTSSERNTVEKIMEEAANNRQQHQQHPAHSGRARSRYSTESNSGDSSLIMQTGWSSSLGSLSSSMQTRTSLPDGNTPFIPVQMPSGSSSDGIVMHTGWSTCSDSTGASKRIYKQEKQSSGSLSTIMHTGWSDDSIRAEQVRQRVSMNIEAKRRQLMDMQYKDDDDDSEISEDLKGEDKPESVLTLNDPEDNNLTVSPIAPKMRTSTQAPPSEANSSGRDSFFMSTGWSSDNLPLISEAGALQSSKHASSQGPPSEANSSGRDSFFMSTGWSNDNLPLVSDSPVVKSSKHAAAQKQVQDDSVSDLSLLRMKTGWSNDNLPLVSDSPDIMSSKHAAAAQNVKDDSDSDLSLLGMKTGWSSDEIPVISPRTSPNVTMRKSMDRKSMDLDDLKNTMMSPARKSSSQLASSASLSLHATIEEEESSMQTSDEEFDDESNQPPPKPSSASSSTTRNSATMIMMDGSFRRT